MAHTARVKHALWNQGRELADLLVDIISAASLDCVVTLTAPSAFFACDHRPRQPPPSLIPYEAHEARKRRLTV